MVRPKAIGLFETLFFASVAISAVVLFLQGSAAPSEGLSEATVAAVSAGVIALTVLIGLLASRRRSNVARWLLALLTAGGVAMTLNGLLGGFDLDLPAILGLAGLALQAAAVAQLFGRAGRAWFDPDPVTTATDIPPDAV